MPVVMANTEGRFPQWSAQETADFIGIRGELEKDITHAKHIKTLWKTIASKMRQRGYSRSAEQCKCKWNTLVNGYKGKEILQPNSSQQCRYFEELHAIFTNRSKKLDKLLRELEADLKMRKKARNLDRSSEEFSNEDDEDDESEGEQRGKSKKRNIDRERTRATAEKCRANNMRTMLEYFSQQQQRLELQWRELIERRAEECRRREQEYNNVMASLENESFVREQHWLDKEDERRAREEARADQRDALLTAILNRIVKGD
eukprot:c17321_g2_i1 orf=258-1037(+)